MSGSTSGWAPRNQRNDEPISRNQTWFRCPVGPRDRHHREAVVPGIRALCCVPRQHKPDAQARCPAANALRVQTSEPPLFVDLGSLYVVT
jgi:hypothetical protein